jgi:hypothetical protein
VLLLCGFSFCYPIFVFFIPLLTKKPHTSFQGFLLLLENGLIPMSNAFHLTTPHPTTPTEGNAGINRIMLILSKN